MASPSIYNRQNQYCIENIFESKIEMTGTYILILPMIPMPFSIRLFCNSIYIRMSCMPVENHMVLADITVHPFHLHISRQPMNCALLFRSYS